MTLEEKQKLAVQAAEEFWNLDIIDPSSKDHSEKAERSRKFIDSIIRTKAGLNWTWEKEYKGDGDFQWCGAFVAACYAKAGLQLKYREKNFASTYRLDRWPQGISAETDRTRMDTMDDSKVRKYLKVTEPGENGYGEATYYPRLLEFAPRAGDILLIGDSGYGSHIALLAEDFVLKRDFKTIEGNSFGIGPDGKKRQGVMKQERHIERIRRIIRPSLADFE